MVFNKHESARQRAQEFVKKDIAGPNDVGWQILDNERKAKNKDRSKKDKRAWKRNRTNKPVEQLEQAPVILHPNGTSEQQDVIVTDKPKKVLPFDAEDSWNYRERMDRQEVGNPAAWGAYEGLIEIYRERRIDDMQFGIGVQKPRRVTKTREAEQLPQLRQVTEQLPDK